MSHSRIALITGGAGGLALATADRLAREGITIVLADMDADAASASARTIPGEGHSGIGINVADEASVVEAFRSIEEGVGPIAILAAFAGVVGNDAEGRQPAIAEISLDLWQRTFAVNSTGTFLCVREFARHRIKNPVEHGRVITVSSSGAQIGGYQSKAAYCASKGAVLSFTKAVARDLAALGITANAIAPGPIDTPMLRAARGPSAPVQSGGYNALAMLPVGRIGRPEEIAAAASYLASIDAAFVTGSTLDVNGGLRMQ